MTSPLRVALAAVALLLAPTLAAAQIAPAALPNLEVGARVWVANAQGMEFHGELLNLSPEAIEIGTSAGPRRMAMSEVWTIMKKDSNWNGFLIGAGVGVMSGLLVGANAGPVQSKSTNAGFTVGTTILGTLLYGGLGAWIDNGIEGRDLVYRRPSADTRAVAIAPILALTHDGRLGLGGTITWR